MRDEVRQAGPDSSFMLPEPSVPRSLACVYLGDVIDRRGCPCPGKWLRRCGLHGTCTVEVCKSCPDYEEQ